MPIDDALPSFLAGLEQDPSLDDPHNLRQRIEALDRLDACLAQGPSSALQRRAERIASRLEQTNSRVYETIRQDIRRGAGRHSLYQWAARCRAPAAPGSSGYDALDDLIGGVFLPDSPSAEHIRLEPEMVPYQPTPARHIFDLIDRTQPDAQDVLIDLGSGLGQVPLMVAACTGARCVGIEIEPAYVAHARKTANALHLQQAMFLEGDARAADLSGGTLYYLYTPFTGTILRSVLDALRQQAASRPIRICSFGPCTSFVAAERWLSPIGTDDPRQLVIFRSHRPTPMQGGPRPPCT